jgi:hypothetical protein
MVPNLRVFDRSDGFQDFGLLPCGLRRARMRSRLGLPLETRKPFTHQRSVRELAGCDRCLEVAQIAHASGLRDTL